MGIFFHGGLGRKATVLVNLHSRFLFFNTFWPLLKCYLSEKNAMKQLISTLLFSFLLLSCSEKNDTNNTEIWKNEVLRTEKAFEQAVQQDGLAVGFVAFAADDVALMRGNKLILGKMAMTENFANSQTDFNKVKLSWTPDFVDVSASGDLAYTYGKYTYSLTDSAGNVKTDEGIFHTVWKRQADGNWKFVWD